MGSGGGTGEAAQLCKYNAEVILIPVTKLGTSKTSFRVGCEKTRAGCTQALEIWALAETEQEEMIQRLPMCPGSDWKNPPAPVLEMQGNQAAALWVQALSPRVGNGRCLWIFWMAALSRLLGMGGLLTFGCTSDCWAGSWQH